MNREKESLMLRVKLPSMPVARSEPCPVQAILVNSGREPTLVNRRMAVGYRDHLARELFADIHEADSRQPADFRVADYDREFSAPADYIWMEPGQEISNTFNLFEFYLPARPGNYILTLHYQADEELANAPAEVAKGIVSSEPVDLFVE